MQIWNKKGQRRSMIVSTTPPPDVVHQMPMAYFHPQKYRPINKKSFKPIDAQTIPHRYIIKD